MITITDKTNCCGCNACGDVCAHQAITFKTDIEGFWYPEVDKEKCTDCGFCEKVCPVLHADDLKKNDFEEPKCSAVQHKNLESLFNSTSGSAFAGLAEQMYKLGGYVGGAIFNEDYSVSQFISHDKKDLEIIRNSKYAQSDSQGFYKKVKSLLIEGEKVLVCGLPCQIAALKAYIRKDYDNLITIDLICRNINSPKFFKKYINYLEEKYNSKIVYFKHKNKELGWRNLTIKVVFEDGRVLYETSNSSFFTQGFICTSVLGRPSCYDCKFKGFPRIADITIGDLWGAQDIVGVDFDHDLGTSVVMVSSEKGEHYLESAKNLRTTSIPVQSVIPGNPALTKSAPQPLIDRKKFYKELDALSFEDVAKKYIRLHDDAEISTKGKIKNILRFVYDLSRCCGWNLFTLFKNIYYNFFSKAVKTNILKGNYIAIHKHCVLNLGKGSELKLGGAFRLGAKRIKGSKLETRLLIDPNGKLITGGTINIGYGADIEVFSTGTLEIGKGCHTNINATIICGERITLEDNVAIGRDVTIRDNNGNHYISRRAYKTSHPVLIGTHSWLCEHSMILPGTKLGAGVISTACSVVSGKHKSFTMINGNPAKVVDEDIYWKE